MADWEERTEQEEKKEKKYVTRRDFYGCVLLFAVVLFAQSISIKGQIQQARDTLNNAIYTEAGVIESSISGISDRVARGIEDANNPLSSGELQITAVDMQAKKATIRMTAVPREYQKGMTMRFVVSCNDGAEKLTVPATMGEDYVFTAETEIPFYDTIAATAYLQNGDTEYLREVGSMPLADMVLPYFQGDWNGGITWTAASNRLEFDGDIDVYVTAPEWQLQNSKTVDFSLQDAKVEVYLNDKLYRTLPAECQTEDETTIYCHCSLSGEDKLILEGKNSGKTEFFFKAKDKDGIQYSYLVESGTWSGSEQGYDSKTYDMDDRVRRTFE